MDRALLEVVEVRLRELKFRRCGFEFYEGVQNHIGYYHQKTHHTTEQTPHERYEESLKKVAL